VEEESLRNVLGSTCSEYANALPIKTIETSVMITLPI